LSSDCEISSHPENDFADVLMQLTQDFTELRADLESLKRQIANQDLQSLENTDTIRSCVALPDPG
jgi:hypothetical protein